MVKMAIGTYEVHHGSDFPKASLIEPKRAVHVCNSILFVPRKTSSITKGKEKVIKQAIGGPSKYESQA